MRSFLRCNSVVVFWCLLQASAVAEVNRPLDPIAAKIEPARTVPYKQVADRELVLHVFEPDGHKSSDRRSAFVIFHGGGWTGGSPRRTYPFADYFRQRGMVAVSVEYRLLQKDSDVTVFDCVKDGRSAIRYLRQHANEFGIDPAQIAVAGCSAGGHVAAGTALFADVDEATDDVSVSASPNALILYYPVIDTSAEGYGQKKIGKSWQQISPLHHVEKNLPPTIIFHGTADTVTPYSGALSFADRMRKAGNNCELVSHDGGVHGYLIFDLLEFYKTMERTTEFLRTRSPLFAISSAVDNKPTGRTTSRAGQPPAENTTARRHQQVAARRDAVHIICHRGAVEFAHENTMEAYRAAFELGADGNEIDIRATEDGVLVCFHDDMVDHLLKAYGDVADYTWEELQKLPFRNPRSFGKYCRIPTLREVFKLHREHAGLMHLDVKRPGLVEPISRLLDEFDMWDHVVQAPGDFEDPRYKPTRGKAGLYLDRGEVDEAAIAEALKKPGERIILEFPQGVATALGRTIATPSETPVKNKVAIWATQPAAAQPDDTISNDKLLEVLRDAGDWKSVASGMEAEAESAERILQRAIVIDELVRRQVRTAEFFDFLEDRIRHRSLHRNWRYCGLDGSAALRAVVALKAPQAVELARFSLWRDDPAVEAARNPDWDNPRSWTDWRTKIPVFGLLESLPGAATEQLCRDYLSLSNEEASHIGVLQFEAAAKTLLAISPTTETVKELLSHRLMVVRGRAILFLLAHAGEAWAEDVLQDEVPYALKFTTSRKVSIAIIGDSTAASYPKPPADRPDLTGWGQVFGEFFTNQVVVYNHARSGRSSKSFIREGHWKKTLTSKPDYVFIQFGHNDQPGKGDRTTDPEGDYRDYLRQYVREARRNGIRPILVTPMTRRRFENGKVRTTLGPWVAATLAVGQEEQVPVVDLHKASVQLFNELGDEGSSDLSPSSSDRTHFSRKGALAIARLVVLALPDAVPRLNNLLRSRLNEHSTRIE